MEKDSGAKHRFFVESLAGDVVELPEAEAVHALGVLRLGAGATVEVFDGAGGVAVGALQPAGRKAASVHVHHRRRADAPQPRVELAFAVPKGSRLDWLLEKAAELGAAALSPVLFQRSVAAPRLSAHARRRWRGICIAAAKQCRADFLPDIAAPRSLAEFLAAASESSPQAAGAAQQDSQAPIRIVGQASGGLSMAAVLVRCGPADALSARQVVLLIGPEGGLTEPEQRAVAEAGFLPVRLGPYTLRIETAAVALLAAVRACAASPLPGDGSVSS